jgi:hypothetical protein
MSTIRTLTVLSAIAMLAGCSRSSEPFATSDDDPGIAQKSFAVAARWVGESRAPVTGGGYSTAHVLRCNAYRTCIQLHPHYANGDTRVYTQGFMESSGCTRVRIFVNGVLVHQSASGCFPARAAVNYAARGPVRRFDRVCVVWTGPGPIGRVCQVR